MNEFDDLIKIKTNNVKPGPGKILISEPFMFDYYFKRSVVLLAEHNIEGSFGVIVNKPMSVNFNEVIKDFPNFTSRIYLGGPVKTDSLYFIHTLGELIDNSMPIIEGLYWGGNIEQIKELIVLNKVDEGNVRFYIGYSGWMPKQLNEELKRDSWVVSSIDKQQIMHSNPDHMWKKSLLKLGGQYKMWINYPSEPTMN
nr:YqgE/AlgH family protein [Bacteroidota bacterium]